ncbi:AAA domain-containing protein [Leucobacter allii]|uniref:AAA domain-containing protein n=1 Tax=Leucobacter allii TaxID=2932247 RepID=A0ABY4FNE3_9MICO|nr:AAA domain-containing protein [Leucobacter allii]UOQ57802.1 AAA domain-containing protein [Leucobacter allii]
MSPVADNLSSMLSPEPAVGHHPEIERASKDWKSSLLDIGGNNRLLYFKKAAGQLDISLADQSAVRELLEGKAVNLRQLFPDPAQLALAEKACRRLAAKQKEALEEYGVSVTYLALGLASWGEQTESQGQEIAASPELGQSQARKSREPVPKAPVFLRSVTVERKKGRTEAWELQLDEDTQISGVLTHVLEAEGVTVDEDGALSLLGGADYSAGLIDAYAALESAASGIEGFRITPASVIGTFTYQKQPMVNDVTNVRALGESDLIAALAGSSEAAQLIRSQSQDVPLDERDPDYRPAESEFLVLDADASQSFVVNAAVAGRNLVVQGPPGTGKSQTIANVIAALLASGKHVLFVAQKRAAIEAVLDRLEQVGLDHLLLDLFAADGSRRFVSQQIRASLDRQNTVTLPDVSQLHHRLERNRTRLVRHKDALFDPSHAWGVSVSDLRIASAAIPASARTNLRLAAATFQQWVPTTLDELSEDMDAFYRLGALNPGWGQRSHWKSTALNTGEALQQGLAAAQRIQAILHSTSEVRTQLATRAGYGSPTTWYEASSLIGLHRRLAAFQQAHSLLLQEPDLDAMLATFDRNFRRSHLNIDRQRRTAAKKRRKEVLAGLPREFWSATILEARELRRIWLSQEVPLPDHELSQLESAIAQAAEASNVLAQLTTHTDLQSALFASLEPLLGELITDNQATKFVRANELQSRLEQHGVGQVVAMLRTHLTEGRAFSALPSELLRWVTYQSILNSALLQSPELAAFNGDEIAVITEQFRQDDKAHFVANASRVRRRAAEYLKAAFDQHPEQHALLKTEVTRKRLFRPVRKLFEEAPDVLLAAKPVWVMSPLQVSRVLPPEQCFDVVIFDEASQVKPADAVPALMRGKQAIVAGDSRQLPPTEFFTKVMEDEDAEEEEEIELAPGGSDLPQSRKSRRQSYTRDAESILTAMDRLLAGQGRSLQWHYRSRDERLIATSNEHIYHRSLTTFPAVDALEAVRHVAVPPSQGIGTTTNSPELEVQQVVELVKGHVQNFPTESLGVITFGIKHQQRIEYALDEAMRTDPSLEAALKSDIEPFFVKAIERVQGDERDAIILSAGYGKGLDGKLRYFWGPILRDGGERRLNVAISRSKKRMTLVTSFSTDDLAVDAHPSSGYKLMYHFTRFMASRGEDLKDGGLSSVPLNPFEIDVKTRLEAEGLILDSQVGVGNYRLDFAIRHPDKPGRHVLAIEADGAAYHSGHTARERDRLRQQLLEARGWRFHRIWSTDWFNDAGQEVGKVLEAYKTALDADDNQEPVGHSGAADKFDWEEEQPQRSLPRPPVGGLTSITDYTDTELVALLKYIRSDSILRSADEEQRLMIEELGFSRRGARIVQTLERIQNMLDSSR